MSKKYLELDAEFVWFVILLNILIPKYFNDF